LSLSLVEPCLFCRFFVVVELLFLTPSYIYLGHFYDDPVPMNGYTLECTRERDLRSSPQATNWCCGPNSSSRSVFVWWNLGF
jgi:hypothetical protein